VVPNQKDNLPVILNVNRSWYPQFLNTGCKIYEYAGFMHSKYVIIDDILTFTGSCNLDYRSFWINFETVFLIYNKEFTTQMLKVANDDFSNSRLITKDIYDKTYAKKGKVLNFFLRVIYPLI
jgi:cardiolipin synthase